MKLKQYEERFSESLTKSYERNTTDEKILEAINV